MKDIQKTKKQLIEELEELRQELSKTKSMETRPKRAEKTLRESEEKYRILAEQSPQGLIIAQGIPPRLVFANSAMTEILGYTVKELLSLSSEEVRVLVYPEDQAIFFQRYQDRLAGKPTPPHYEIRGARKDGSVRWVEMFSNRIEYRGKPAVQAIFVDITDRKRAEEIKDSIYEISESAHSVQNLEEFFRSIHRVVGELMPSRNFYISLYDPDSEILSFPYFVDEYDEMPAPQKLGKGLTEYVLRTGEPLLASPKVFEELVERGEIESIGAPSIDWLGVPLKRARKIIGVLVVQSYTEGVRYGEEEKNILRFVCSQVAVAIEHKQAEEAVLKAKKEWEETFDAMSDWVCLVDLNGRILRTNRTGEEFSGISLQEILGQTCHKLLHGTDERIPECPLPKMLQTGKRETAEIQLPERDRWLMVTVDPMLDENGIIISAVHIVRDITEHKKAEEKLRKSEEKYHSLVLNIPDVIWTSDEKGCTTFISPNVEKVHGYTAEEIYKKGSELWLDRIRPEDLGKVEAAIMSFFDGGIPYDVEYRIQRKDGKWIWLHDRGFTAYEKDGIRYIDGIFSDITERKRAEEALRFLSTRQEAILAAVPDIIMEVDNNKVYTWANQAGFEFFGEDVIGKEAAFYFEGEREIYDMVQPLFSGAEDAIYVESWQRRKDGQKRLLAWWCRVLKDETGNVTGALSSALDITERKRMDEALRASEEKYRTLTENIKVGIYRNTPGPKGKFIEVNPAIVEMFGYGSKEEVLKINVSDLYQDPSDREKLNQKMFKDGFVRDEVILLKKRDGMPFVGSLTAVTVRNEMGEIKHYDGVIEDITEQEQLRAQLLQSEKLSSLGQLISGVAHELNNPLTGVLGFSQLLLQSEELTDKTRQSIETVNREADRARKIVENLLTVARQRRPEKRKVQLSEVIDRILDLRAYEMRVNNIEVIKKFYPDCPPLLVDESQIEQVFLNIIINAEQAMLEAHGKGCLEVETRWDTMRDVVKISFHDDGPGIPKEHLLKVFDPFFTTKPIGKGTGLGLSIAYGIVREHGGLITAVREKDQGSTFTVELPVAEDEIPENITVPPQPGKIAKVGNKKILVVDDEAAIVDLVRATLEEEGYLVETANDGNSAVRKIEEGSFDAVVSDLKMPGKGGTDIYMYCKDKKPELAGRFLLLTGDVAGSSALRLMKEHQVLHLEKPFDLRDLISSVNLLFNAD